MKNLPDIPESLEVARDLPSPVLYVFEQAGEIAREVLHERVCQWVEQRWTQRQVAAELGCSQSAVKRRCLRVGLKTEAARRGGQRASESPDSLPPAESEDEANDYAARVKSAQALQRDAADEV